VEVLADAAARGTEIVVSYIAFTAPESVATVLLRYGAAGIIGRPGDSGGAAERHREQLLDLHLEPGDKIDHAKFGEGIVAGVDGDEVTAVFQGIGQKKLSLSFAPIRKVN